MKLFTAFYQRAMLAVVSAALVGLSAAAILPQPALAAFDPSGSICQGAGGASAGSCASKGNAQVGTLIRTVVGLLMLAVGVASVVMVIIGAFQYASSGGDAGAVGKAKTTIFSAIAGIVIALSAYAIVAFVVSKF
ncbi:MAG TPA: hypothetical protein VNG90_01840 [Candidatus Acidoferrum sp.]|nr:hypothetical protein [Candidatus Acidoferrum sp.]